MQLAKSIYDFIHTVYALVMSVCASILFIKQGNWLWSGVLLTVLPGVVATLWRRYLAVESGADERESVVSALALTGLAVVLVGDSERGWLLLFAFIGVLGLLLQTYWATSLGARRRPPAGADQLRQLNLYDAQGAPRRLDEWRGRPCLVLVLRSGACPFSAVELRNLATTMPVLRACGAAVICLVPDSPGPVARRSAGVETTVLQLRDEPASRTTGLILPAGGPFGLWLLRRCRHGLWPGLIALDAQGEVRYSASADNYRLPPRLESALPYLEQHSRHGNADSNRTGD
ncbi:hypothetical protein FKG94_10780 [Exilibacterium tricleocarpae]|uniref:Redoxin domain-containing protein n=1 Tax=Exilibacterium tricleocarpae TaxID=2591008 RepID=A0A545TSE4_9GAMM|nr:hypothetical protein [Exilibacterium tricleocarpae]TQV80144.1 hypothetical protein FKG94_10780 [Exilibacterium tricleocarpae]